MKLRFFTFILGIVSALQSYGAATAGAGDDERAFFAEAARGVPSLNAIQEMSNASQAVTAKQLSILQGAIRDTGKTPEDLLAGTMVYLKSQKALHAAVEETLTDARKAGTPMGWPLRSSKIGLNFDLVLEALTAEGTVFLQRWLDTDFTTLTGKMAVADEGTLWDSSLGRTVKTALLLAWMAATDSTASDLSAVLGDLWWKNSPSLVALPLSEGVELDLKESAFTIDVSGKSCFVEPHNGFIFGGGHGDEVTGEIAGAYPAFDCSSFTAHFLGMMGKKDAVAPSTMHWWLHWMKHMKDDLPFSDLETTSGKTVAQAYAEIVEAWSTGAGDAKYRNPLESMVTPVIVASDDDITPGMIYVRRGLNQGKIKENPVVGLYGAGGHMGIVVGVKDGNVLIASGNRSMKETDGVNWDFGIGLQWQELGAKGRQDMFFTVNSATDSTGDDKK